MSPDWNGERGVKYVAQGEIRAHTSQSVRPITNAHKPMSEGGKGR